MAAELERLLIQIDASTEGLRRQLRQGEQSLDKFSDNTNRQLKQVNDSFDGVARSAKNAARALGAIGIGYAAREVVKYADGWKRVEGRLRVVTKSQEDFNRTQSQLIRMADQNRSSIDATVDLYSRMSLMLDGNESAMRKILPVTDALSKGIAIMGDNSQAAQGALVQFTQGLATNFEAAGQEIRSLQENGGRLTKALVDGLNEIGVTSGATTGDLMQLAKDGVLTTENSMDALASQIRVLDAELAKTPKTIAQSLTKLDNAFLKSLGTSEAVRKSTNTLAISINALAENLDTVALAVGAVATVVGGRYAASLATGTAAMVANTTATMANARQQVILEHANLRGAIANLNMQRAMVATTGSMAQVRAASVALTAAQGRYIAATNAASASTIALRGALAFFGGPVGLAITAVAGAIYYLSTRQTEAEKSAEAHEKIMGNLRDTVGSATEMTDKLRESLRLEAAGHVVNAKAIIAENEARLKAMEISQELLKDQSHLENIPGANTRARGDISDRGERIANGVVAVKVKELRKRLEEDKAAIQDVLNYIENPFQDFSGGGSDAGASATEELEKLLEKRKEYTADLKVEIEQLGRLAAANEESEQEYQRVSDAIERENELRRLGLDLTTAEGQSLDKRLQQQQKLEKAIESTTKKRKDAIKAAEDELRRQQDMAAEIERQLNQPYENAAESIQRTMADTFEGIFSGSINSAGDAADAIKGIFYRMAAEIATLELIGPQGLDIQGALSGKSSGGSSGLMSNLSNGKSLYDIVGGSATKSLLPSGLASSVDDFGLSIGVGQIAPLNAAQGAAAAGVYGPIQPAYGPAPFGAGIEGGLSSMINPLNIGAGALGSWGAGKVFGEGMGTTVGSAAGGLGAGYLAAGMANPIVALAILAGSFLGGGLGSLFNGKPSSKQQAGLVDFSTGQIIQREGLTGKKYSEENVEMVNKLAEVVGQMTSGMKIAGQAALVVNNRDGLGFQYGEEERQNFKSPNAFFEGFLADLETRFPEKFSESLDIALEKIDFGDGQKSLETALNDVLFAINFDKLGEMPEVVSAVDQAIEALNDNFDEMRATALRLGLEVEKVSEAQAKAMQEIQDGFSSALLQQLNPAAYGIAAEIQRYNQQLKDAATLGADTAMVERLHLQNMAELSSVVNQDRITALNSEAQLASRLATDLTRLQGSYQGILDSMNFGSLSAAGPKERFDALTEEIDRLEPLAKIGNLDAQDRLAGLLQEWLQVGGEALGFNAEYAELQKRAQKLTEDVKGGIDRQLSVQEQIAASAQQQIETLQKGFTDLINAMGGKGGSNSAGRDLSAIAIKAGDIGGRNDLTVGQVESIARSLTGYTGASGSGQLEKLLNEAGLSQDFNLLLKKAAGVPGFATGGLVGGIGGHDANLARLTKGEFVLRAPAVKAIGIDNLSAMNQTGKLANDNSAEIRGLRQDVQQLTRVVAASGQVSASELSSLNSGMNRLANTAELQQHRRA